MPNFLPGSWRFPAESLGTAQKQTSRWLEQEMNKIYPKPPRTASRYFLHKVKYRGLVVSAKP
jgi:hypothetical protein